MADQKNTADPHRLSLLDALRSLQELIDSAGEEAGPPPARAPATPPEATAGTADAPHPGERDAAELRGPAPASDWDDIPVLDEIAFEQETQGGAADEAADPAANASEPRRAARSPAAAPEAKHEALPLPPGEAVIEPTPPPVGTGGAPGALAPPSAAPRQTVPRTPLDARALASHATALIEAELRETDGRALQPALAEELRQLLERFLRERLQQPASAPRREQTP